MITNLNDAEIWDEDEREFVSIEDNSTTTPGVSVYFRGLEKKLIKHIEEADAAFGCVAWLTNYNVLDALSGLADVSVIVQKEDFLRPDTRQNNYCNKTLQDKYERLKKSGYVCRYDFPFLGMMSTANDPTLDAIRCVGNHNSNKDPAFPRMHNKFMVFAKKTINIEEYDGHSYEKTGYHPYAVWTGSFNFTKNAGMSLENAVYITVPNIAKAYLKEFEQIAALSEPLDWDSDWMRPEWRIGT